MGMEDLSPQVMVVKAFDGSKRSILGEIVLPLEIGPSKFDVLFQVMNIEPAYTMLLGRPWINAAGAVASTLHQRVKFVQNGSVITIHGEEEILVSKPVSVPYVENAEQDESNLWHSLEVVGLESNESVVRTRDVNPVVAHIMAKSGYQQGKGLGPQLQGMAAPIPVSVKSNRFGLGYEASLEEEMNAVVLDQGKQKKPVKQIPHLKKTFPRPAQVILSDEARPVHYRLTINMLDVEKAEGCNKIRAANEDEMLMNWITEPVIDVVALK